MIALTTVNGLVTTVEVSAEPGTMTADLPIIGVGVARCRPEDLFIGAVGERIALGRAIQDFGRRVEENGLAGSVSLEEVDRVITALVTAAFSA